MQTFGLAVPPMTPGVSAFAPPKLVSGSIGGILPFSNKTSFEDPKKSMGDALAASQSQPVIAGLAGHIKSFWNQASQGKRQIEDAMMEAVYARRGEYTSARKSKIAESKQPLIYMMVAASKMRQIEALLRDVLLGSGTEKPWTLRPTPSADLPPDEIAKLVDGIQEELQAVMASGVQPTMDQVRERLRAAKDQLQTRVQEEARVRCERMERKMEDQMVEGGLTQALDQFITDLSTFKTAFLKGPVVRNKPALSWGTDGQLKVENALTMEWERVDPFCVYPAPWARHIGEAPLIEKHKLTREDLNQLIGVEGYDEAAIRKVIEEYGRSGLSNWLSSDPQVAAAEGKDQLSSSTSTELIDALQYWGSASGRMLVDWGLDKSAVPDLDKEYQIEAWLVGSYVIKAVLNADPLARRPYYAYSFQTIPGSIWGNSPYDLSHDCQDMCNGAARSLAANLGIASGPQVAILANRIPAGEDVTEMFPWKIWQFESDPMGSSAPPITFFQPQSNAAELMAVYEKFSQLADEYTGIPRYMSGFQGGDGGAGRTASGMSMMIGNASKVIKQVLGGIDTHVITKVLERQYYYNMRYLDDPDLKGDVKVVARGAISLQVRETAQVRRNEFLAATANPIDMQIIGLDGRGELLRESLKSLDMSNPDKIVPPMIVLKEKQAMDAMAKQQQQQAQLAQEQNAAMAGEAPSAGAEPKGQVSQPKPPGSGQRLVNGAPVSDSFQPA